MARGFKELVPNSVRFGSKADVCVAKPHVRFTPDSDRKSGLPQKAMSASPPKADACAATSDVGFGPIADIGSTSDEHSDARQNNSDLGELARLGLNLD